MGYGDQLMATGMARGFAKRGKRVAFGNQQARQIIWDHHSEPIFRYNPNIAPPGSENDKDLHWIGFYRGARIYNWHDHIGKRWIWNYGFKAIPGQVTLTDDELKFAERYGKGFVIVEPHVPDWKPGPINKRWHFDKYAALCGMLQSESREVLQFVTPTGGVQITGVRPIKVPDFRHALAVLKRASLFIGSEGGLHHGAAAVGTPAVVIFGSWVPPQITGYQAHVNLAHGIACGSLLPCAHCRENMEKIRVNHVYDAAKSILERGKQ